MRGIHLRRGVSLNKGQVATALLLMLSLTIAHAQTKQHFKLAEDAAEISDTELGERSALNPTNAFDLRVQQEVDSLDWGFNLAYPGTPKTSVSWSKRGYTLAHRKHGLVLSRDELKRYVERLTQKYGPYAEGIVYLAAIAHERAHTAQFRYYKEIELDRHPAKVVETQADIIAGTWIGGKIFNPGTFSQLTPQGQAGFQAEVKRYLLCADETMKALGATSNHDHGNSFQRSEATALGASLSFYTFLKSLPPSAQQNELVQQNVTVTDLRPGERMMEWSLRKAYRLCGLPFPRPEQTKPTPLANALALLITARPAFADVRGAKDMDFSTEEANWYNALLPIPGAQKTQLCIDRKNPSDSFAVADLYAGPNQEEARRTLAEWAAKIGARLPEGYVRTAPSVASRNYKVFTQYTWTSPDHRTVRLRLSQAKTSEQYNVNLWVDEP